MGKPKLPEDREVLRAKFENVNRLLQTYGDGIARLEARLQTLLIVQDEVTPEQFLREQKEAMIPLSQAAVDTSLIQEDLEATRAGLGPDFADWLHQCFQILNLAHGAALKRQRARAEPARLAAAVILYVFAVIVVLKASLRPAEELRNRLQLLLNRGPKERVETLGQAKRRVRDERIRLLSQLHKSESTAEILKRAKTDEVLSRLDAEGVRVTSDVIRNALGARSRGNRRRNPKGPKNTSQEKKRKK